jgi:ribosomal protein S18 acetylase RimI-like enzyme
VNNKIIGYILWTFKSGFRNANVIELEQIAILPKYRGFGYAKGFILKSLNLLKQHLRKEENIKYIVVSTRVDNYAKAIYKDCFMVEKEIVIENLFSSDEVIMYCKEKIYD